MKRQLYTFSDYFKSFAKWLLCSFFVGAIGGILGTAFHFCLDFVTEKRAENGFLIYFLPLAGVIIALAYRTARKKGALDTDRVILAARERESIPFITVPLIFVSTVITHLFGGSAGREGAALQIGGALGYKMGKLLRFSENDRHIITMSGMSSLFSALFGTPITAAIFSIEVLTVGTFNYTALLPCVLAAVCASAVARAFGIVPMRFADVDFGSFSAGGTAKVIVIALLCAFTGSLFCFAIKACDRLFEKITKNGVLRALIGGAAVVLLTLAVSSTDYNGAGTDIIERALSGEALPYAFALKIIFTAITVSAGFKGGEIVPSLFIGATLGCTVATVIGFSAPLGAATGMIALFCSVVNCPLASLFLATELFGTEGLVYFAIACAVSYMMSGYSGIYHAQKFVFSKTDGDQIDVCTK